MNNIPISRDIKNIIKKYLTISKRNVNRNYRLILANLKCINKYTNNIISIIKFDEKRTFCYCIFCDEITDYYENMLYSLELKFQDIERNTKYTNIGYSCNDCYQICKNKFEVLEQLKKTNRSKLIL